MLLREPKDDGLGRLRKTRPTYYNSVSTKMTIREMHIEFAKKIKVEYVSEDTKIRKDVHDIIKTMLKEGKEKTEILQCLNDKYSNSSISEYFESYINDHSKKINSKNKEKDGEEIE